MTQPWYREVSRQEWKTFLTTFAAWTLDAFDFTIITFVLTDIRRSFEVNLALAGALATVTLFFRMIGGIGAGTLADKYGRKGPILFAIAWYTAFAFLSGLSTSYVMLFMFRGLFGIGMGGMWAAGMPLALEQWPAQHRGIASGILQGGYSTGFLLSSLVYQLGYPFVSDRPDLAWRVMLWAGVIPAMIIFVLMTRVSESPMWLEQKRLRGGAGGRDAVGPAILVRAPSPDHPEDRVALPEGVGETLECRDRIDLDCNAGISAGFVRRALTHRQHLGHDKAVVTKIGRKPTEIELANHLVGKRLDVTATDQLRLEMSKQKLAA